MRPCLYDNDSSCMMCGMGKYGPDMRLLTWHDMMYMIHNMTCCIWYMTWLTRQTEYTDLGQMIWLIKMNSYELVYLDDWNVWMYYDDLHEWEEYMYMCGVFMNDKDGGICYVLLE